MNLETLIKPYAFQRGYLEWLIEDVADEQMAAQPGAVANHPAWQLGHLAWAADSALGLLGGQKSLDDAWCASFIPKSKPIADRSAYPTKAELLRVLDERRAALVTQCAAVSDETWQQGHPIKPLAGILPTLWQAMHFLMLTHESTHLGQIATWRAAMGLPQALSKASAP